MRCEVSVPLGDPLGMEGVCSPPSPSNCAGPLVMGVARLGRELLHRCGWMSEAWRAALGSEMLCCRE